LQGKYDEPVPTRLRVATLVAARRRRRVALLTRVAAALLRWWRADGGWYANAFVTAPASAGCAC